MSTMFTGGFVQRALYLIEAMQGLKRMKPTLDFVLYHVLGYFIRVCIAGGTRAASCSLPVHQLPLNPFSDLATE